MNRFTRFLLILLTILFSAAVGSARACENSAMATQPAVHQTAELGEPGLTAATDRHDTDRDTNRDDHKTCGACCGMACASSAVTLAAATWPPAMAVSRVADAIGEAGHGRLVAPPLPPPRPAA